MRKKRTAEQKKSNKKKQDKEFVIIGSEEELCSQKRLIDYGDIQEKYNSLRPIYQNLIDDTVRQLTGEAEFAGYNLRQILDWFAQYRNPEVNTYLKEKKEWQYQLERVLDFSRFKRYMIAMELADTKLNEIFGKDKAGEILGQYANDITYEKGEIEDIITKKISEFQNTVSPKRSSKPTSQTEIEKTIYYLCEYFLISPELIYNGQGNIYSLADPYHEEFLKDLREDENFRASIKKISKGEYSTRKVIEKYIEYRGLNPAEAHVTEYAIIKYSGNYQILNTDEKYAPMKKLIDNWINTLYDDQMKHQEIYDKMFEKGAFSTLVALSELEKDHKPT